MDEWQAQNTARMDAVKNLLASLDKVETEFVGGQITKEEYHEGARVIDERLQVLGLRLAVRPWNTVQGRN